MTRPNILLISADQQGPTASAGDARSRHRISTGWRKGYAFFPVHHLLRCLPTGARLILTGQLAEHGVHDNGIDLDPEVGEQGLLAHLRKLAMTQPVSARRTTYHTHEATGTRM